MKRRTFLELGAISTGGSMVIPNLLSKRFFNAPRTSVEKELKISLAQWSLHRSIASGEVDPFEFAAVTRNVYEIRAIEYVNQFYVSQGGNEIFWQQMNRKAEAEGVENLLIMVDNEGNLGVKSKRRRRKAVKNHFKWVDAARLMNCHSIRINAFGNKEQSTYRAAMVDSLGLLCEYAEKSGINVIVENHGLFSSEAALIVDIIKQVDMENCGTFPDFGNWCTSAVWGNTAGECATSYDPIQGVSEFLPLAKAVSAKSYDFNGTGGQDIIDYPALVKLVKESNYQGYIGIEYEGNNLNEYNGIVATKKLIESLWNEL